MLPKATSKNKLIRRLFSVNSLSVGIAVGLLGFFALLIPPLNQLEQDMGLDWLFNWRGEIQTPENVMVAAMDRAASDALGFPNEPRKWPRSIHADLVTSLTASGSPAIGFDVLFSEARESTQDQQLANAISQAGNTILFQKLITVNGEQYRMERVEPPIAPLREAALDIAPFALPKVPAKISQVWLFKTGAGDRPTLPMVLLHVYFQPYLDDFLQLLELSFRDIDEKPPESLIHRAVPQRPSEQASYLRALFYSHAELHQAAKNRAASMKKLPLREVLQSWVYALTRGDHMILNLYGPARSVETVPIHQLLALEGGAMRNKAVFVGFSEILQPEQKDDFYTAYSDDSGVYTSGVELMATTFSNLLHREAITPLGGAKRALLIFLAGALLVWVLFRAGTWGSLLFALIFATAWGLAATWLFSSFLLWIPVTTVLFLQIPAALIAALVWHHRQTQESKSKLRHSFERFAPKNVVDHLDRTGELVTGQTIPAICLFTDMESYTPLGEQHRPEALQSLLNEYFTKLQPAIYEYGGEVQDMTGDSMLALWSGSNMNSNRACCAALAIRAQQTELETNTRIGIHQGDIYQGVMGTETYSEFRPVGDAVNTAKRLESLNKTLGTSILASAPVARSATDIVHRRLGFFTLKGKSEAIEVFEICGIEKELSPTRKQWLLGFETALAQFESGDLETAESAFQKLNQNADDGPCEYYLKTISGHSSKNNAFHH